MSTEDDVAVPSSEEEEAGLADMKKVFETEVTDDQTGKKKSYWSFAMETMGMASGKDGDEDLWLETVEQGVPILKKYIREKDAKLAEEQEQAKKKLPFTSYMDLVPLDEFHTTQTNFLKSFLKWSIKDKEDIVEGSEGANLVVNASKARRRLDSYFEWMKDNMAEDMAENPLTFESVKEVHKAWSLEATHSKDDQLIWWFDLGTMDTKSIKSLAPQDQMRYIVWFSHLMMFDHRGQDNGLLLVEALDNLGFWKSITLVPMELGAKMDRFTIGVLPIKMKGIYMFGCARWVHLMVGLMKPFMSKKMRSRMIIVTEKMAPEPQKYCDDNFGQGSIPDGFMSLNGGSKKDALIHRLNKKGKQKEKKAATKAKEEE